MFFLAIRHLISRKRQTLLTLIGILLGSAAYVIISGMMLGFREFLIDQLINNDAHIRISAREEKMDPHVLEREIFPPALGLAGISWVTPPYGNKMNHYITHPGGWFERLDADPRVEAFSPQFTTQVMLNRAGISVSAKMIGSIPSRQVRVTNIQNYMKAGRFTEVDGGNRVILGSELMEKLGAHVNENIFITGGTEALAAPSPFRVVGVFQIGIKMMDEGTVFTALSDAQRIQQSLGQINEIAIRLRDVTIARQVATDWSSLTPDKVQSWDQANANFFSVFKMQDMVRYLMTLAILLVAGFGIYNILNMVVSQKRRDIAILRSMGYLPADILFLFFVQGVILGFIGGALGLGVGYLACRYIETISLGGTPMGSLTHMLVSYNTRIYTLGFIMAAGAATVASLLPARTAGRLSPIEIIRSGE